MAKKLLEKILYTTLALGIATAGCASRYTIEGGKLTLPVKGKAEYQLPKYICVVDPAKQTISDCVIYPQPTTQTVEQKKETYQEPQTIKVYPQPTTQTVEQKKETYQQQEQQQTITAPAQVDGKIKKDMD